MTEQPEKPDFIADQFGNVHDVRNLKYTQKHAPSSMRKPKDTPSPDGKSSQSGSQSPQKSESSVYIIGALVAIVAVLVCGFLYVRLQSLNNANVYFNEAEEYFDRGDYAEAIASYDKAIQLRSDFGQAYNNRGLAYHAKEDYDKAIEDANKAIELLPNSASVYNNRGYAYNDKGDYDKAIADFDKALQLNSEFAKAYYNRGLAYYAKGDYDKTIMDFGKAIQFTSETSSALLHNVPTGVFYELSMRMADRLKAIQFEADLPLVYINRGAAYYAKDELDKAIADYNKAIQLQPDLALAYYDRGVSYYAMGDYDKAIADFMEVLELNNDPTVKQAAEALLNELRVK
jgi:tetratricopeptide (TPR) repeat protein